MVPKVGMVAGRVDPPPTQGFGEMMPLQLGPYTRTFIPVGFERFGRERLNSDVQPCLRLTVQPTDHEVKVHH